MEALIEKCTSEKSTQDNWDLILKICEEYATQDPKTCIRLICKRLFQKNSNISVRAITLLDACSKNCGIVFNRELSSRDFTSTVKKNFGSLQRIPSFKLIEIFEKWAEEFKNDSELSLAAGLYGWVKTEHSDMMRQYLDDKHLSKMGRSRQQNAQLQAKEEEELAKAIALSLRESENKQPKQSTSTNISSQPNYATSNTTPTNNTTLVNSSKPRLLQPKGRVIALYDFEAAEDNELTFKTGDVITLLDDSDENWWLGSTSHSKGLFPAQFVKRSETPNAIQPDTHTNPVRNGPSTSGPVQLNEQKLDDCLHMISNVDPTGEFRPDPPELSQLEAECLAMGPLVDPQLEIVDKRILMLTELNQRLLDAFQIYHDLMSRQNMPGPYYVPPQPTTSASGPYQMTNPVGYNYAQPMPTNNGGSGAGTTTTTAVPYAAANVAGASVGTIGRTQPVPPMMHPAPTSTTESYPINGIYVNPQQPNYPNQPSIAPNMAAPPPPQPSMTQQQQQQQQQPLPYGTLPSGALRNDPNMRSYPDSYPVSYPPPAQPQDMSGPNQFYYGYPQQHQPDPSTNIHQGAG